MTPNKHISSTYRKRSAARLMAVQCAYTLEVTNFSLEDALKNAAYYQGQNADQTPLLPADLSLVTALLTHYTAHKQLFIDIIAQNLPPEWPLHRLDKVLLSILQMATTELHMAPETKTPVLISEYLDIAHSFYGEKEPGFIHAILEKIAQSLRS